MARVPTLAALAVIIAFLCWAHFASGVPVFDSQVPSEPGWEKFRAEYQINRFGEDGQFVRAVQNGYNLFFYTHKYAPRFTRKSAADRVNSCGACHSAEDLAYSFVSSDRFDPGLGKRLSFEDRVRWCYAASVDGFVPTVYDPAVRDIRLMARAVAHHLQLSEGALRNED
jgi:cytochrome c